MLLMCTSHSHWIILICMILIFPPMVHIGGPDLTLTIYLLETWTIVISSTYQSSFFSRVISFFRIRLMMPHSFIGHWSSWTHGWPRFLSIYYQARFQHLKNHICMSLPHHAMPLPHHFHIITTSLPYHFHVITKSSTFDY